MTKVLVYCASVLSKPLWNWISSCTIIFPCIHCFPHYFGDRIALLYCIQYYYVDECCRHLLVISKTTVLVLGSTQLRAILNCSVPWPPKCLNYVRHQRVRISKRERQMSSVLFCSFHGLRSLLHRIGLSDYMGCREFGHIPNSATLGPKHESD